MELKVLCECGQKYKFDVEPVNDRMPHNVNCPICGRDGTPFANSLILQAAPPVPVILPVAAASTAPSLVPAVPTATRLAVNRPPAPAAAEPALALTAAPAAIATMPPPIAIPATARVLTRPKEAGEFNMGLGILGAFIGAIVAGGAMYAFYVGVGFRFPFFGVGIGAATGYGAKLLFKGTSSTLGGIAAAIALAAVVGTQFLMYGAFPMVGIISAIIAVVFTYRIAG